MKTYPLNLREILQQHGYPDPVKLMWEVKGPPMTSVAWLSCYLIGRGLVIVETYREGGWDVFSTLPSNSIEANLADLMDRCRVKTPVA